MDGALLLGALGLGLAGVPHCAAMCGAPCAALTGTGRPGQAWGFHLARVAGYATAGALAAASVNSLQALGALSPIFRPLWTVVHAAALMFGLWLAVTGRQPAWMERSGRAPVVVVGSGWQPLRGPGKAVAAGALWVAWPCGLLQSAVLVAALANSPWSGAGVMLVFATVTGGGLAALPWLWRYARRISVPALQTAGVRLAGVMLVGASGWALGQDLLRKAAAYCGW